MRFPKSDCMANVHRSGSLYVATELVSRVISLLTIISLTRILGVSDFGRASVLLGYVGILGNAIGLGIPMVVPRELSKTGVRTEEVISSSIATILLSQTAIIPILVLVFSGIKHMTNVSQGTWVAIYALAILEVLYAVLMNSGIFLKLIRIEISLRLMSQTLTFALSIFLGLYLGPNRYLSRVMGTLMALLPIVIIFSVVLTKAKFSVSKHFAKGLLRNGIPLVPHKMSKVILGQFDKVFIGETIGFAESGLYSFAYSLGEIPQMIVMAANKSFTPWLFDNLSASGDRCYSIKTGLKRYLSFVSTLISLSLLVSPEVSMLMGSNDFRGSLVLVPPIIASTFFMFIYHFYSSIVMLKGNTFFLSLATLISGASNVILNVILIPILGFSTAGWTTLVSYLLLAMMNYLNVRYVLKITEFKLSLFVLDGLNIFISCVIFYLCLNIGAFSVASIVLRSVLIGMHIFRSRKEIIRTIRTMYSR